MMKVLITGANSYIGLAAEKRLKEAGHRVDTLDMTGDWKSYDFSGYDSVFHVAGIAHDTGNDKDAKLYYSVNRDLALETAAAAQAAGVGQFVFMSSMLVYNGSKERNITAETVPEVRGAYGDSKLQADLALQKMNGETFRVAVLRPPMVFGKGCKGNFPRLAGLVMKTPVFPDIDNRRSMLHIDNLSEFVRLTIENRADGVFFPQNAEYFRTTDLAVEIAAAKGKKLRTTKLFNWAVYCAKPLMSQLRKLFGDLTYDKSLSEHFDGAYRIVDNAESVRRSV